MKKLIALFLLIFVINGQSSAQYYTPQNKVWIFGKQVGLDFSSGSPVHFSVRFSAQEGSAAVSDASGHLLFYTDGMSVRDRTDSIMPLGTGIVSFITTSASQAAVVAPVIGNASQYYIFSMERQDTAGGAHCHLAYSIVDMTLNDGLGDILPSARGIMIDSLLGEKMITVAGNDCNIWLIVHAKDSAIFKAYEINASGLQLSPVISHVGFYPDHYSGGVLKVSHDRRRIVNMNFGDINSHYWTDLYDFDAGTGLVSNCFVLNTYGQPYGAEFSPDNTKLYAAYRGAGTGLFQYDVSLPDAQIMGSEYKLSAIAPFADLRLAPDSKIYLRNRTDHTMMDRINDPDRAGASCNFQQNALSIAPDSTTLGLPSLFWAPIPTVVNSTATICTAMPDTLLYTTTGTWTSNDTGIASVANGIVTGRSPGRTTVTYVNGCGVFTTTVTVFWSPMPITGDTSVCSGSVVMLSDVDAGGTWYSSNTSVATSGIGEGLITGVEPGFTVIHYGLRNNCFVTATVTVLPLPGAGAISGPASVCAGLFALSDPVAGGVWSASNSAVATISSSGTLHALDPGNTLIDYAVTGVNGCTSMASFSVTVQSGALFALHPSVSNVSCYGAKDGSISVAVIGGIPPFGYLWSGADTANMVDELSPGVYMVTITEAPTQCELTDTFTLSEPDSLQMSVITQNDLCNTSSGAITVTVIGGTPPYIYAWSGGGSGSGIVSLPSGSYSVLVTDGHDCSLARSITINEDTCLNVFVHDVLTPNGDGINDSWVIDGLAPYPHNTVQVFDKWGTLVYEKDAYDNSWHGQGTNGELPDGTYFYLLRLNAPNLKGGRNVMTGAVLIKR